MTRGRIVIENDKEFRNTNASIEQVVEAFARLVAETTVETSAVNNARVVVGLLGHSLPLRKPDECSICRGRHGSEVQHACE